MILKVVLWLPNEITYIRTYTHVFICVHVRENVSLNLGWRTNTIYLIQYAWGNRMYSTKEVENHTSIQGMQCISTYQVMDDHTFHQKPFSYLPLVTIFFEWFPRHFYSIRLKFSVTGYIVVPLEISFVCFWCLIIYDINFDVW